MAENAFKKTSDPEELRKNRGSHSVVSRFQGGDSPGHADDSLFFDPKTGTRAFPIHGGTPIVAPSSLRVAPPDSQSEQEAESFASRFRAFQGVSSATPAPVAAANGSESIHASGVEEGFALNGEQTTKVDSALHESGRPMAEAQRDPFERVLRRDLRNVRIHTGSAAEEAADFVGARAFTLGSDIVFGKGEFRPGTKEGDHLLAHEMAHVVQGGITALHRKPAPPTKQKKPDVQKKRPVKTSPIIPLDDFINYLKEIEGAHNEKIEDTITRIRKLYYGGALFQALLPDRILKPTLGPEGISENAYSQLTAHGNENGVGDNPSPYLQLRTGEQIDLGHLLLGLDTLIHPTPSVPYTTYDVPSIDVASWIADLAIGAVWAEQHEMIGQAPQEVRDIQGISKSKIPDKPDINAYYELSAPMKDLAGDADSFGVFQLYKEKQNPNAKLSGLIENYYNGKGKNTRNGGMRWQNFCARNHLNYKQDGNKVEWDSRSVAEVIKRTNRFADLYGAGKMKAAAHTALALFDAVGNAGITMMTMDPSQMEDRYKPSSHVWKYVPTVVHKFLTWLRGQLEEELRQKKP